MTFGHVSKNELSLVAGVRCKLMELDKLFFFHSSDMLCSSMSFVKYFALQHCNMWNSRTISPSLSLHVKNLGLVPGRTFLYLYQAFLT